MTVLGKDDIERSISRGEIGATRGDGRRLRVEPASMDLHLGNELTRLYSDGVVRVDVPRTYPEGITEDIREGRGKDVISPGEFVLGTTEETVDIPNDTIALLHGRSSVGRLGLFIENAGLIDPGFEGEITLELFNSKNYPIALTPQMRIGQLTFHDVKTAPEVGYSVRNGNKYDGQEGATASKLYEDFE